MRNRAERARSFETVAEEYERHRPDYPTEAVAWAASRLALESGSRVLDVGAGTGKLTRVLAAAGFDAVAVEPGRAMLDQLRLAVPEAEAHEAPAEAVPLPDASVDAAFAAQAFHWFDRERALPELQRVVRPSGGLALVWNWWDERDPLQAELGELVGLRGSRAVPRGGAARRAVVPGSRPDDRGDDRGDPDRGADDRVALRRALPAPEADVRLRVCRALRTVAATVTKPSRWAWERCEDWVLVDLFPSSRV
ncbi:MAG TPA: class I SAM-dependent methyltransferase [Gaiellaceae bacterium]|nr:class I SAM-dependent methyltransferase [Gaiellaceae bacterium]